MKTLMPLVSTLVLSLNLFSQKENKGLLLSGMSFSQATVKKVTSDIATLFYHAVISMNDVYGSGGSNIQFEGWINEFRISNTAGSFKPSAISENNIDNLFLIYPNLSKTHVYVNVRNMGTVAINSMTGQKVLERNNFYR